MRAGKSARGARSCPLQTLGNACNQQVLPASTYARPRRTTLVNQLLYWLLCSAADTLAHARAIAVHHEQSHSFIPPEWRWKSLIWVHAAEQRLCDCHGGCAPAGRLCVCQRRGVHKGMLPLSGNVCLATIMVLAVWRLSVLLCCCNPIAATPTQFGIVAARDIGSMVPGCGYKEEVRGAGQAQGQGGSYPLLGTCIEYKIDTCLPSSLVLTTGAACRTLPGRLRTTRWAPRSTLVLLGEDAVLGLNNSNDDRLDFLHLLLVRSRTCTYPRIWCCKRLMCRNHYTCWFPCLCAILDSNRHLGLHICESIPMMKHLHLQELRFLLRQRHQLLWGHQGRGSSRLPRLRYQGWRPAQQHQERQHEQQDRLPPPRPEPLQDVRRHLPTEFGKPLHLSDSE